MCTIESFSAITSRVTSHKAGWSTQWRRARSSTRPGCRQSDFTVITNPCEFRIDTATGQYLCLCDCWHGMSVPREPLRNSHHRDSRSSAALARQLWSLIQDSPLPRVCVIDIGTSSMRGRGQLGVSIVFCALSVLLVHVASAPSLGFIAGCYGSGSTQIYDCETRGGSTVTLSGGANLVAPILITVSAPSACFQS